MCRKEVTLNLKLSIIRAQKEALEEEKKEREEKGLDAQMNDEFSQKKVNENPEDIDLTQAQFDEVEKIVTKRLKKERTLDAGVKILRERSAW